MVRWLLIWLLVSPIIVLGQSPVVPSHFFFADLKIKLTDRAREEIQEDVNALTRSQKYFRAKVNRANLYLPIIERILKEEKVPDDFKYLCIQESALIPDAVSSSNAVGFWQFKKPTGQEVGLRIDSWIDERMNIVSSTRAASTYLKTNNSHFDNWIYALLSYNTGLSGAQKLVQPKHFGAKKMTSHCARSRRPRREAPGPGPRSRPRPAPVLAHALRATSPRTPDEGAHPCGADRASCRGPAQDRPAGRSSAPIS